MKILKNSMEKEVKSPVFARAFASKGISVSFFKQIVYKNQVPEALGGQLLT